MNSATNDTPQGAESKPTTTPGWGTRASRSRVFLVLNPFMRLMLHLPIKPMQERLMLLTYTGRRSGRRYTLPLSYVADADGSLLVPGGGAWKRGIQLGRPVTVRLLGRNRMATPEVIRDVAEIERLLPRLVSGNPRAESFIGVPMDADGRPNRARLEQAVGDGFAIVRLRLND
jgi:hypothetical protein